ncbi:MAG: ribosome recycling factor [Bacteroidales bacterium]|nr:ribosome recycling factor [Bacteroidales bacterium]
MNDDCLLCLEEAKEGMELALQHLKNELQKLRAGKASPQMLEGILIDYYGKMTPLIHAANINTPDARTIVVQPFDKSTLPLIDKAIQAANLGFNPQNNGEILRIIVPPLTEERRRDIVKKAKSEGENCKISIRSIRKTANDESKKLEKEGTPEDDIKKLEDEIQKITNSFIDKVDKILELKEKDIMTV